MQLRKAIITLLLMSFSLGAWANICEFYPNQGQGVIRISLPSTLTIPRDAPVGTVIYESPMVTIGTIPSSFKCSAVHNEGIKNGVGATSPGSDIFPIGLTGIGWQWVTPKKTYKGYPTGGVAPGNWGWNTTQHAVRFVKISATNGASIPSGSLGYFYAEEISPLYIATTGTNIQSQSCETPDIKVDLGEHNMSQFEKLGSYSEPQRFNLQLKNCPSGINRYAITLTPTAESPAWASFDGAIKLNSASSAKGLAVQLLLNDNQPVKLGQKYFVKSQTASGDEYIDFRARLIRTALSNSEIASGTANAEIAFVVNFL